jgi:hypothetical protein
MFDLTKLYETCTCHNGGNICKHNAKWLHKSWLKASSFILFKKHIIETKPISLILGKVLASGLVSDGAS